MAGRNAFTTSTDTVAHDLPLAQERQRKRAWEQAHPARRYLIPVALRDQVAALAESLMENIDPVACVLFDYAESCHQRGRLKLEPRLNPQGRKHRLVWEEKDDPAPTQPLPHRHGPQRQTDTGQRSLKGQTVAYRLGDERHSQLKLIAAGYNLRLADVLAAFFRHSLAAYQAGKLQIRREPVVVQMQVQGWSEAQGEQ
jgi:hypothetical protein